MGKNLRTRILVISLLLYNTMKLIFFYNRACGVSLPEPNVRYQSLCIYIHKDCYVYLVIMYSVHVELAVSPVNAGYLVRTVSLCYT